MLRIIALILIACAVFAAWFAYSEIHSAVAQASDSVTFTVEEGETVRALGERLDEERVIRNAALFRWYVRLTGKDTDIHFGTFTVERPITLARVVAALAEPMTNEKTITILPGWDLRDIAEYFIAEEIVALDEALYAMAGQPAVRPTHSIFSTTDWVFQAKPIELSIEGYIAPETYRIFSNASAEDVLEKLLAQRKKEIETLGIEARDLHDALTLASIVEREVRGQEDRRMVADIFLRRNALGWALQADSTVHYAVGKKGDVFTTNADRASKNAWNTYEYPGLPPGPISTPSIESIAAVLNPLENDYWYFLTDLDGNVHYAKTLGGHEANAERYLRSE